MSDPFLHLTSDPRLHGTLAFLAEADRMKSIVRQTFLVDGSRQETDAEHSWELALMVMAFAGFAPGGVDPARAMRMVVIHDLVEIDAGDSYAYDASANAARVAREMRAAERIFGLLPAETGAELRALWLEFEARETPDARFARALDRLQPLLHAWHTGGRMWQRRGVRPEQVREGMAVIAEGIPALADLVGALIADAEAQGFFGPAG
ncbi:HD domain-containing protein [Pseudogemmobacter sonorensis]|uniref:HD domain-containing protein n=1 Tax=Pseudogemmobacter sonorensis TaxID=2989681 RepID=UPI0036CF3852